VTRAHLLRREDLGVLSPHESRHRSPVATLALLVNSLREPRFRFLVFATTTLVIAAGLIMRILDHRDYRSFGLAMWWAVQTVTTVGYGDAVPHRVIGRVVAAVLMIIAIGFLAILTSLIASSFVIDDPVTKQRADDVESALARIEARLARIEAAANANSGRAD
jgi:voltage-gated potassium channel